MNLVAGFFKSSLGKKYIMALTGIALFIFVVGHLVGNLQVFLGPEAINRYGSFLKSMGELLWGARIGLLIAVGLHIWSAVTLSAQNKAARPEAYGNYRPVGSTYASRTMLMSGLIIAAFVIYHLLHYTALLKAINLTGQDFASFHDAKGRHDVYRMMIVGFSNPIVSIFYIVAMSLLMLHLSHGLTAMFNSLGIRNQNYRKLIDGFARVASIAILIGYVSIPLAVMFGILK